jgi:hypothetical protein
MATSYVTLRKDPVRWAKIPWAMRKALLARTRDVERLRELIAKAAKVSWMPPVTVLDSILATDAATVEGYVDLIPVGSFNFFGTVLAAQAVLCTDDAMLRSILVHEFAHCFDRIQRLCDHLDSGSNDPVYLPGGTDEAEEESALVDPAEWFGDHDAEAFVRWGDLGAPIHQRLLEQQLGRHLKIVRVEPDIPFEAELSVHIPPEILEHIIRLRGAKGTS